MSVPHQNRPTEVVVVGVVAAAVVVVVICVLLFLLLLLLCIIHINVKDGKQARYIKNKLLLLCIILIYPSKIATWNVRTMYQARKLANVHHEMKRLNISVLGVSEVRWPGSGEVQYEKSKFVYSGGDRYERGV